MLCQHCGLNQATRHYQTTVGNEIHEIYLCAACAGSTGFDAEFQKSTWNIDLPALMSDMLGLRSQRPGGVCPTCGLRLEDLSRSGRTGCADCYRHFAPALTPYIRRIHGNARHTGRTPIGMAPEMARRRKLEALKRELQECIQTQAFERAAELRDEIAKVQKEEGQS